MERAKLKEKFEQIYTGKIFPKLTKFEDERKKIHKKVMTIIPLLILALVVIIILSHILLGDKVVFVIMVGIILIIVVHSGLISPFKNKIKKNILNEILKIFGEFRWYESEIITIDEMKKTKLFPRSTIKFDDDSIAGTFKGIDIYISETELQHKEGSGKTQHIVTDFNGVLIKIKMNKNFTGHTIVQDKGWLFNTGVKGLEKVTLEDPEFEKLYNVYSNDQVEARYLLTTSFMERLKNISTAFYSSSTQCAFLQGYVVLALSTGENLFEVGSIYQTLLNKKIYEKTFYEMISILELVQHFKLDQKLGL